jgi:geranylgeranyl pyrophosphate synthase
LVALVRDSGALDRARNLAYSYARRAKECINVDGDSEYARALQTVPDFILEREN